MRIRQSSGASLAMVVACAVVIILVGGGLFFLMEMFGGFREFQHATDAGNLNVAKSALKIPNTPLSAYQNDFASLIDPSVTAMDLQNYNRVVGQAYLVALNAMADRTQTGGGPSAQGLLDAQTVAQEANGGSGGNPGVGQALYSLFAANNSSNPLFAQFGAVANTNSTRMLGTNGKLATVYNNWDVSFIGAPSTPGTAGDPTNLYINTNPATTNLPLILQGGSLISSVDPSSPLYSTIEGSINSTALGPSANTSYLAGYTPINLGSGGTTWTLYGVPLYPTIYNSSQQPLTGTGQPHHVSARDFYEAKTALAATLAPGGQGIVPPNAFKSVANSAADTTTATGDMEAYAVASAQNQTFQASIPNGYIVIYNPPGALAQQVSNVNSTFNNELMPPGIFIATTTSGGVVFTTDPNALQQWANYNANGHTGSQPPLIDADAQPLFFFTNPGDANAGPPGWGAYSIASDAGGNPVPYQGVSNCQWTDVSGASASAPCDTLLANFQAAYPDTNDPPPPSPTNQLMAVEQLKQSVVQAFDALPITVNCPASNNPSGLRWWIQPGNQQQPPAGPPVLAGIAARSANNPMGSYLDYPAGEQAVLPDGRTVTVTNAQISADGTLSELFQQALTPSQTAMVTAQVVQRMLEIDPTTTAAQALGWLNGLTTPIPMNSTWYIVHNANTPGIGGWSFTSTPPSGATSGGAGPSPAADGSAQYYTSGNYQTIDMTVDADFDNDIHQQLYTQTPDPSTTSLGMDVVVWTPSSGYQNMLGQITFQNYCSGTLPAGANYGTPPAAGQQAGGTYTQPD